MAWKYQAALAHVEAINKLKVVYGIEDRFVYLETHEKGGTIYCIDNNDVLQQMVEKFSGTRARCMDWLRGYERGVRDSHISLDKKGE